VEFYIKSKEEKEVFFREIDEEINRKILVNVANLYLSFR
jgi:hypothetical protein